MFALVIASAFVAVATGQPQSPHTHTVTFQPSTSHTTTHTLMTTPYNYVSANNDAKAIVNRFVRMRIEPVWSDGCEAS